MSHTSEYWVLDFDRCLGSEALYTDAYIAAEQLDPSIRNGLYQVQMRVESEGGSFDIVSYLDVLDETLRDEFLDMYERLTHNHETERYRAAGATALIEYLQAAGIPFTIMTYGGELWQEAKLKAARLDVLPHRIIQRKEKAKIIDNWYDTQKRGFAITGENVLADSVCLVDDKAVAFRGLHRKARGYYLHHNNSISRLSQQGIVPKRVVDVGSLEDILSWQKHIAAS